ncbi:MAG: hypothetical protein H8D23_24300, partial [Candidatus Brocadiales bacterium]|nr:hypothetical protein [Candidatus Brocadiales bacterium]
MFGYNKTKNTAKTTTPGTSEKQANPEPINHITKDSAEKLIREKVEDAINASHSDIKDKIEEAITKLSSEFEQKVANAINAVHSDLDNKIEESLARLSNAFDQKIGDAVNASRSDTEGKIEESTTKLFNELDERIKLNSDNISSSLRNEYRKHTEDLLKTAKSTTLAQRMYIIGIGSAFVVVIILLSLIGYSKIKRTANDTVMAEMQRQANMEATKYATKDFAEILIREKAESTINELRQELDARLEERVDKIFGKFEKEIELKNSRILSDLQDEYRKHTEALSHTTKKEDSVESLPVNSSKVAEEAVTNKQAQITPEKTISTLLDYDNVLTRKKTEREH